MIKMRIWGVLCILLFGVSCSSIKSNEDKIYQGKSSEEIFQLGEHALAKKHYQQAAHAFEVLNERHPFSESSEKANRDLVYAYYQTGDNLSAEMAALQYINFYPNSKHIDYVYYLKGLSEYEMEIGYIAKYFPLAWSERDLTKRYTAFQTFGILVRRFPSSPYVNDARQRMIHLRNEFARHELSVAKFYQRRGDCMAAINRASQVVLHYEGSPEVIEALKVMAQSYQSCHMPKEAEMVEKKLKLNYPNQEIME